MWDRDEVRALLPPEAYAVVATHYGLDGPANFEGRHWNLRVSAPLADVAAELAIPLPEAVARLEAAKAALAAVRAGRVRPALDDKVLTSWNALAVAGLARAARALDEPDWADLALAAADALRRTAWRNGRLLATRKGERVHLNAYLDDHAFLLAALLELMQTRFRIDDYAWARELADVLLDEFEDKEHGGFFFTSHDHERLFHRTKPAHDNATPSGNGIAASALLGLGHLCAEPRYVEAAERAVQLFAPAIARSPAGFSSLVAAEADAIRPPPSVLLAGDPETCAIWQRSLRATPRPGVRVYDVAGVALPAELTKGVTPERGAVAWLCVGTSCLPPIADFAGIERALDAARTD